MKDQLLFLNSMITPKIITVVYWLLLVAVVIYGLIEMFGGYSGFTFQKFIMGIVYIVIGAVAVRVWCELLIVIFKIHENLQKLNK